MNPPIDAIKDRWIGGFGHENQRKRATATQASKFSGSTNVVAIEAPRSSHISLGLLLAAQRDAY